MEKRAAAELRESSLVEVKGEGRTAAEGKRHGWVVRTEKHDVCFVHFVHAVSSPSLLPLSSLLALQQTTSAMRPANPS